MAPPTLFPGSLLADPLYIEIKITRSNPMDYELIILHALVEIVMDEDASEHLKELRIAALNKVLRRLNAYHHLGFIRPLTTAIAERNAA